MKTLILVIALLITIAIFPKNTFAATSAASSAALTPEIKPKGVDLRVQALGNVLNRYKSILGPYAGSYVASADKYNVDWKLLPSIAGLESTFGRAYIEGTYNVYGWGSGRIYFKSWEDGIDEINSKLRSNYMDKWGAQNVWEIGPIYAESPTWAVRVNSFMTEIDNEYFALSTKESLKLNL